MTDYNKYIKSTGTHYISNSGHDENGKYHGGKAGDQSDEWTLRSWYNRPWSCVLRWNDQAAAELAAQLAIEAAQNNKIGYDQYQRKTFWTALESVGYRPANITTACESDCTAGVTAIWKAVGNLLGIAKLKSLDIGIYSGNMRTAFKNAGFTVLTASKYRTWHDYLLPGDVLLYEGHHAATNVTIGKKAADSWHPCGSIPAPIGGLPLIRITGSSVNVRSAPNTSGKILGVTHAGDVLEYLGQASADGWLLAVYKGENAWVSPKYAEIMTARVRIAGGSVNIRSEPSAASKILRVAHAGETLPYTGADKNGWHGVITNGKTGWVSGKYSEVI